MKLTLQELKDILEIKDLHLYKSKTEGSKRRVAYSSPISQIKWTVMTNDGDFDPELPIYAVILQASPKYPWIAEYDIAAQISNVAGSEPDMVI